MTVELTELDNGMIVATDRLEHVQSVALGAWVDVGARNETPEINGISHMLEHMAFKGTRKRTALQISEEIEAVGGQMNAYTSRENTAYYCKVLHEDQALAIDVIADILQNSTLDEKELERERQVILQEIGQANDTPDDIVFDYFQETALPNQALGRSILGSPENVSSLSRDDLFDFMSRRYSAKRMVFSASGNVNHNEVVDMVASKFTNLPVHEDHDMEKLRYEGGQRIENRDLEQAHVIFGLPTVAYADDAFYDVQVFSMLLGGGMSSRLFQEIREKRGLVYSVYSFSSHYVDGGLFSIYAGTGPDDLGELMPVMCDELKRATVDLSEEEVNRARAQLKAMVVMGMESNSARCETLARQIQVHGGPQTIPEIMEKIEAVDLKRVIAAGEALISGKPTVTALGPVAKMPEYDTLVDRLRA
ncbi:M16 family metallopeptidase [Thalassospira marina]|uniref:Peptidase M16 n=1 Tax=Thalassospira marina TaxID=2048283 RepID=A0A2N3KU42_9PROT|nr:pitrilysin family protein [Thalassospira marina]AUG54142.1 peptidase M16 [Thalassospira marina]PKR54062.1 peptidase M16 [Thalassospira marina]